MSLRKKIIRILVGSVMLAILSMSAVAMQSMYFAKEHILKLNNELSTAVAHQTENAVAMRAHQGLNRLTKARAELLNERFNDLKMIAMLLAKQMSDIESNPDNYAARLILPPKKENEDIMSTQLFFNVANPSETLKEKAYKAGAIEPLLLTLNGENELICSAYIASKDGYSIVSDIYAARAFDDKGNVNIFDAQNRRWYRLAKAQNAPILSDVTLDVIGGEWDITAAAPYYKNGEFAGVAGVDSLLSDVNAVLEENAIGDSGIAFIVDENGKIIFSSAKTGDLAVTGELNTAGNLKNLLIAMQSGSEGSMTVPIAVDGEPLDYYVTFCPLPSTSFSLGLAMSENELKAPAKISYADILSLTDFYTEKLQSDIKIYFVLVLVLTALLLVIAVYCGHKVARRIVEPLIALKNGVEKIAGGNLNRRLELKNIDEEEIVLLANSFNDMTARLKDYIERDRQQAKIIAKENAAMELAAAIQQGMLPKDNIFAQRTDFKIDSTMLPAKMVGGDFYDFYLLDENHLILTIADVSDKGVPAALFMMMAKTILKNNAQMMKTPDDLAAVMTLTNKQLAENNEEMMFVTAFIAMLDLTNGSLTYVNGGHCAPFIFNASNSYELKAEKNCVLGIKPNYYFKAQQTVLAEGDTLLLYTDGVTEAQNEQGDCFGKDRLADEINNMTDKNKALSAILAAVDSFVGGGAQTDDITMLALSYKGRC